MLQRTRLAVSPLARISLLLAFAAIVVSDQAHAVIDLNNDGIPDVWALKYNCGGLSMTADTDGDGFNNREEAAAGTNPFRPDSVAQIKGMTVQGNELTLSFPTVAGKVYQVRRASSPSNSTWENVGSRVRGSGHEEQVTIARPAADGQFYHVLVQDTDTDGDGATDFEEEMLGFDTENRRSGGAEGRNDLAEIEAGLQGANAITIAATDPSASETGAEPGAIRLTRKGAFNALSVAYTVSGSAASGVDYAAFNGIARFEVGQRSVVLVVDPVVDGVLESDESVVVTLNTGAGYTIQGLPVASVIISDDMQPNGTGLTGEYFNDPTSGAGRTNSGGLIPPGVAPTWSNRRLVRTDALVSFAWSGAPATEVQSDYFSVRWSGEILPQFSQIYTFETEADQCVRLWVNGKLLINRWPGNGDAANNPSATTTATMEMVGGVRVPIHIEFFDTTSSSKLHLRWQSASQAKQIIPTNRLFVVNTPRIYSPTEVILLKNSGPYTYQIQASGSPTAYAAANLPPGWTFNSTTGRIQGTPTQPGAWEIPITATNGSGSGSALLRLEVIDTGGGFTRDVWTGVPGSAVASIPLATTPASSQTLTTGLESPENAGDNFGARLRGYITAPATGAYRFWIAADDSAELWISNDDDSVNSFRRAVVTAPVASRAWTAPGAGKSEFLWLDASKRYYFEVRHKEGAGSDHVSVGWLKPDEGGIDPSTAAPTELIPVYVLSPYVPPAPLTGASTLYTTSMTAQGTAQTSGYGSATLRLSADETTATVVFNYANLTSPVSGKHVHNGHDTEIIFDMDTEVPNADGSYTWVLGPVGNVPSREALVALIKSGNTYINIHTAVYPAGEIKGFYKLQAASQTFTPPAPAPSWTTDHTNRNAASRFLIQTTFGPSPIDLDVNNANSVLNLGYEGWINAQFGTPPTYLFPYVYANRNLTSPNNATYSSTALFNGWWKNAVTAPDQLRQRVAFALSQIMVTSEAGVLDEKGDALSDYYDTLLDHSFGNFRTLLEAVTLHPAMGRYLDMLGNDKPNINTGRIPNENYAREILQLFALGLYRMWPDGSLILNAKGQPVPTYEQNEIIGFAHAFTGWHYHQANQANGLLPTNFGPAGNWVEPMKEVPGRHFTGQKRILNNVVLPGLAQINGTALNPYATHSSTQIGHADYQKLPADELKATHDAIFYHPNTPPFICRQLIQRLVTSTPSRGYIYRVAKVFENNGAGVRGDMKAVIKAILLDYEARSPQVLTQQGYGKQREPVLRVTATGRAFPAPPSVVGTYVQEGNLITVTTTDVHRIPNNNSVYIDFGGGGAAGDPTSGAYTAALINANSFTVRPYSTEGACTFVQEAGSNTVTINIPDQHGFAVNSKVYFDFKPGATDLPPDGLYTVVTTTSDRYYLTITMTDPAPAARTGTVVCTREAFAVNRSGQVALTYNDWNIADTNTALGQTPLRSPTVFNYYEPDYQFPGVLAQAGLATPEFQLSSDTNVMNQTNFLYQGIFNTLNSLDGVSSFKNGARDIAVDARKWMGIRSGTSYWTDTVNLPALIDELNTLLLAGQLPSTGTNSTPTTGPRVIVNAKQAILDYVSNTANLAYAVNAAGNSTNSGNRRDRLRAVIHLIITSPDFTIQK